MASSGIDPYGHALLAAVTGLGEDALTAALRPAVMANVLIASADGYSYRHALICEAVLGDLLPGEDERQHARYAGAIDADPSLAGPGRAAIEAFEAQVTTASFVRDNAPSDADGPASDADGPASAADGPASAADGTAAARAAWDEAARAWEALGQPYELAVALTFAAEAELACPAGLPSRDREAAAGRLRAAALVAARLDARPLADTIASLARRAGVTLGDKPQPRPDRAGLTDRELEVLRLVAAGRSNRDIAAGLFISAKTASVHVSNILAKLGAANRTEAAALARARHLI